MTTITNTGVTTTDLTSNTLETAGDILINTTGNPSLTVKTSGAGNNPFVRIQADTNYWDLQSIFSNTNDELDFRYNGSSKMMITKEGYVTKPNQPSFSAHEPNGDQTGVLTFQNVSNNIGNHYVGSTGRFTAPVAGNYYFNFYGMSASSIGTSQDIRARFLINNASHTSGEHWGGVLYADGANYVNVSMATVLALNVNDHVSVEWQSGYNALHSDHNMFCGFLIG